MTRFSFEYGFDLLIASFNFVMKHKRLFVYMLLANLIAMVVMTISSFMGPYDFWFDQSERNILLYFSLCEGLSALLMVPLIYAVIYLKSEKEKTDIFMMRTIWNHVGSIIGYVTLTVITGLVVRFGLRYLGDYFVPAGNRYGLLFVSIFFFLGEFILGILALFLLSLLYYFVLVIAASEKVGFVASLQKSFTAVKHTIYSIIGGALAWNIIMWVLYVLFGFLLFLAVGQIFYMPIFLLNVISLLINLIFYTVYYTVYVIFQTLLYLKYKKELGPVENTAPAQEQ